MSSRSWSKVWRCIGPERFAERRSSPSVDAVTKWHIFVSAMSRRREIASRGMSRCRRFASLSACSSSVTSSLPSPEWSSTANTASSSARGILSSVWSST